MSVGYNIIDGLINIIKNNGHFKKINICELTKNSDLIGPGIYHSKNGKNSFPITKCDAFKNKLCENNLGERLDIALFKFCYIDFRPDTDVNDLFNYYLETIEYLKKKILNLKIIHVAVPLFVHTKGLKDFLKNLLKGDISKHTHENYNLICIE